MKTSRIGKLRNRLRVLVLALALGVVAVMGSHNGARDTRAISTTDTTSYVSVGEIFDTSTKSLNDDNFYTLLKYISGNASATIDDIDTLASAVTDASEMRAFTLDAGTEGEVDYSAKTSSQDIVVRLGGLDWQVMYLSKDNSGNSILTLWLDNNKQDVWADRTSTEGTYYGFLDGALYSDWSYNWYNSTIGTYPSALYGASYINAVTLNNGGVYSTSNSAVTTGIEKSSDSAFAVFTMEEYGLTEHLVTPRQVSWQENQSSKTIQGTSYNYPNDAWSTSTPDDGFYSADYNYAELAYSDAWADSYLWLPSVAETGYNDTYKGLWKASTTQRQNYDGSTTSSPGSVGSSSGSAYPYSWLRSGSYNYAYNAYLLSPSGANSYRNRVGSSFAVRPSLHLNLNSVELSSTRDPISEGEMSVSPASSVYDGAVKSPTVAVTLDGDSLVENSDYTLVYTLNGEEIDKICDVGTYTITAKGIGGYRSKLTATYTVTAKNLTAVNISEPTTVTYTGSAITQAIAVVDGDITLVVGEDYSISYSNNTNVGSATITIVGEGNYTGTITKTFEITALAISNSAISVSTIANQTYTGSALTPAFTLTHNGTTLASGTDYSVEYSNNINVTTTATITIIGKGNYNGSRTITFTISARDISSGSLTIGSVTYTGSAVVPTTSLVVNSKTLAKGTDYTVSCTDNINSGTASMTVTGIGNYTGTISKTFTVGRRDISEVTISPIAEQQYTGSYIKPELTMTYNGASLVLGTDYSVEYSNNITLGTSATAVVTGLDNYTGEVTLTFSIVAQDISDDTLSLAQDSYTYSGEAVKLEESLTVGSTILILGDDYILAIHKGSATGDVVTSAVDVGSYTLVATGKGNYTGSVSVDFVINSKDLSAGSIVLSSSTIGYTGKTRIPTYSVKLNTVVVDSSNYTVTILSNDTQTDPIEIGTYTIQVVGQGGYTGTLTATYSIVALDISGAVITYTDTTYTYNGSAITPEVLSVVIDDISIPLSNLTIAYSDNIGASTTAKISVTATGNYTGTASTYFTIEKAIISSPLVFSVGTTNSNNGSMTLDYTGNAFEPVVVVTDTAGRTISVNDYAIEYRRNNEITTNLTDIGTISIVVSPKLNTTTGTTNLSGVVIGQLTISPIDMTNAYIEVSGTYEYNNVAITPSFVVYVDSTKSEVVSASIYTYEFSNNIDAGSGDIVVSFNGNYVGTTYTTFNISARDISNLQFTYTIPEFVYDGTAKTITWEVEDSNGADLTNQYIYSYSSNINAGTAKITFTGMDNYTGVIEKTFVISPATIENMTINDIPNQLYTGNEIRPEVIINIDENTTLNSAYYVVSYSNNILIGPATVTVVGVDNYTGSLTATFEIVATDISTATISNITDVTYTMSAHTPKPVITLGETRLIENTDYTLGYSNNINAGTATITITGINGYSGTTTTTFVISPADINNIVLQDIYSEYVYTGSAINTLHINNTYFNGNLVPFSGDNQMISIVYSDNTNVGTATITITPYSSETQPYLNFTGTKTITFEIVPATITYDMCSLDTNSFVYTGSSITPIPTITLNTYTLIKDTDYTLAYTTDSTNVGTKELTITAVENSNFTGSVVMKYYITAKSIVGVTTELIEDQVYNRNSITPSVVVKDGDSTLVANTDYTLEYSNNINVGTATITIRGKGNYLNTTMTTTTFEIVPAVVTSITLSSTTKIYDRKSVVIGASSVLAGTITLYMEEYTLTYYRDNVETTDFISAGDIVVVVTSASDNFLVEDTISTTYTITPAIISNVTLMQTTVTYNTDSQAPTIAKVMTANNLVLDSSEYSVDYYRDNASTNDFTNVGVIVIDITSNSSNFEIISEVTAEYEILPKSITDSDVTIRYYFVTYDSELQDYEMLDINNDGQKDYMSADQVYIAYLVHPEITYNAVNTEELTKGTSFTFTIVNSYDSSNVETATEFIGVGEYVTTITAMGNYTGTITDLFKVNPRDFTEDNVNIEFLVDNDFAYTGEKITLDLANTLKLTYTQDNITHDIILEGSEDYSSGVPSYRLYNEKTLEYEENGETVTITFEEGNYGYLNNINVGTGMLFLQGADNFDGIICVEFNITALNITAEDFNFELEDTSSIVYTGTAHTPALATYTYKGNALTESVDYVVSYSNNINASSGAKVIITGINNYQGIVELPFTISQKVLEDTMLLKISDVYYNGTEQKPNINLIYNSMTLSNTADYEISYNADADFVNVNDITITITAVSSGNYSGSLTHTYKIMPRTLRSIVLSSTSGVYNRLAHNVTFVIRDMDNLIISQDASNIDVNYYLVGEILTPIDIATSPMIEAGVYQIEIIGLNNYTGSLTTTYTITRAILGLEMMTSIDNQTYTMSAITPDITMTYLAEELVLNTDYTVIYSSNTNVGVAEVLVVGQGNYSGEFTGYFSIVAKDLSDLIYDNSIALEVEFTGNVITPSSDAFTNILKFNDYSLLINTDFIIYSTNNSINVGEYDIQLKGIGNYTGTLLKVFTIVAKDIDSEDIIVSGVVDKTYTGASVIQNDLAISNSLSNSLLYTGVDFTIEYLDNINVVWEDGEEIARARIIINAIDGGNYTGSREVCFTILAKSLTDADITVASIDPVVYTGSAHEPTPEVKFGNTVLGVNDIIYSYENNTDYGKASVIISAVENGNFTGSITRYFEIGLTDMQDVEVSGIVNELIYNGSEQKQLPVLTSNGETLVLDEDYTLTYSSDVTNVGEVSILIKGINNFSGIMVATYNITPLALSQDSVVIGDVENKVFTGSEITPSVVVTYNGSSLSLANDYTLTYSNNINATNNAIINITFVGNYTGTATKSFVITAKELTLDMVSGLTPKTFTGSEITPEFEIIYNGVNYLAIEDMFTLSYRDNVNVGTAYIDITGKNNFTGSVSASFEITIKTLTVSDITLNINEAYIYTGSQITPEFSILFNENTLSSGNDYTYTYGTNINAGNGEIYLEFKGNYAGSITATFVIDRVDISSNLIISNIVPSVTYTATTLISEYSLTYLTYTLNDNDYTVVYLRDGEETSDLVSAGEIIVRFEGKNNYKGTLDLTYNIVAKLLSSEDIEVGVLTSDLTYTGNEIQPEIIVSMGSNVLVENVDYTITYENNINVSTTAKIIITAVAGSNYQGNKQINFEIVKRSLNISYVSDIDVQMYTGAEIKPSISLIYNDITLVNGVDYSLEYSNNINVGDATILITGMGNFDGTIVKQFVIGSSSIEDAEITGVSANYVFSFEEIKPSINVTMRGQALVLGTDYIVTYSEDTINVGEKQIIITGIGNYNQTRTLTYSISAKNISDVEIEVSGIENKSYNLGTPITQDFIVRHNGNIVYLADSYTYEYSNNINAGTATLTIIGKGNYTGTKVINFSIAKLDTIAYVNCSDVSIYEENPINLTLVDSNVDGIIRTELSYYVAGTYTYNWTFVPTDSVNYNISSGSITLTAIALQIEGLVFSGTYKTNYFAYDVFDATGLIVSLEYNSGKIVELSDNKYIFSVTNNTQLRIGDVVMVTYSIDSNITERLPIVISQRVISINNNSICFVANGQQQYLNITFTNASSLNPVNFEIEYFNITNNTIADYILEKGIYRATITLLDDNYTLENNQIEFEVNSKTITSTDNSLSLESGTGFSLDETFTYEVIVDKEVALQELGKSEFDIDGDFVSVYKFYLDNDKNVTIRFNPSISDLNQLNIYKLVNNNLIMVSFNDLGDGIISINCNSADKLYLFKNVGSTGSATTTTSNNDNHSFIVVIVVLFGIAFVGLVIYVISNKFNNKQNGSFIKRNNERSKESVNMSSKVTDKNSEIIKKPISNNNYNFVTNNTVKSTKPHQIASTTSAHTTSKSLSDDELIKKYVIFDADGRACGLRDGAPASLLEAYEQLKRNRKD